jgi:hypothetical protein
VTSRDVVLQLSTGAHVTIPADAAHFVQIERAGVHTRDPFGDRGRVADR